MPLRLSIVVAAAALLAGLASATAPPARAADDAVVTGETTFIVQPEKHRVRARADIRIAYDRPSTISGGEVIGYVLTEWGMAVPDEATNVVATRGGARQRVTVRERDGYDEVRIALRPDLPSGQTASLRVTYDLPDGGARSESPIRVGRAYVSFYVFAHGDDQATVRIEVPAGFDTATRGGDIEQSATADGGTSMTTIGSVDDQRWYVIVEGERPDALRVEELEVELDGEPRFLEVRSWPEDDLWAQRVRDRLTSGLVALHELNGLDWPVLGPLRVTESATQSLSGYAGFYDPGESGVLDEITISEEPDELVIVHEAAHAWFNDSLLTGRWISEGLADAYAVRALERLGWSPPEPDAVHRDTRVAFALNLWGPPGRIDDAAAQRREAYGYDASRFVVDELIGEIGEERMREVLAAADEQAIAFAGAPKRETHTLLASFRDWRYLLDLLQQVGGSTRAAELFKTWIVSDVELPVLADHEDAVRRYEALVERADGWLPGHAIRSQMARWAFDDIDRELELADLALDLRDRTEPLEARLGLDDGGVLRSAFEGAVVSFDNVVGLADEELETLEAVARARETVGAERDPLVTIGLLGSDTTSDLAEAAAAYRGGRLGDSRTQAAEAVELIDGADEMGTQRAAAGGAFVLLIVIAGGTVVVVRRRRRHPAPVPASVPAIGAEAPGSVPAPGFEASWTVEPPEAPATLAARTEAPAPGATSEATTQSTRAEDEEGT